MVRNFKRAVTVLVILILAASTFAFAAANTIERSNLGYKASVVTGYTITDIRYDLLDTDLTKVKAVIFSLTPVVPNDAAPVLVKISTVVGPPQNFGTSTCVVSGASPTWTATCTFGTPVNDIDLVTLDIIASSSANLSDT